MSVSGDFPVESPPEKEWHPVPEDMYQVVIKDIDEKDVQKYKSTEMEVQFLFKFVILEGEDKVKGESLSAFVARKWFSGSKSASPSKLVNLVKAVYGYYYPKLDISDLKASAMSAAVLNDLIGKQVRVSVKFNDDKTGNKITDFMSIKEELKVSEDIKIASPDLVAKPGEETPKKEEGEKPKREEEKDESIPF